MNIFVSPRCVQGPTVHSPRFVLSPRVSFQVPLVSSCLLVSRSRSHSFRLGFSCFVPGPTVLTHLVSSCFLVSCSRLGFQFRFAVIHDSGSRELDVEEYFLKRLRLWRAQRGKGLSLHQRWRYPCQSQNHKPNDKQTKQVKTSSAFVWDFRNGTSWNNPNSCLFWGFILDCFEYIRPGIPTISDSSTITSALNRQILPTNPAIPIPE